MIDCDDSSVTSQITMKMIDCDGINTEIDCDDSSRFTNTNENDSDCDLISTDVDVMIQDADITNLPDRR